MKRANIEGFTLLEVLMALTVFALIVSVVYIALGTSGEGFKQLQASRDQMEQSSWLGKQLRADVNSSCNSSLHDLRPITVKYDARGSIHVDELSLLVREAGHSGLSLVHYALDEEKGVLIRASRMAWAREGEGLDKLELGRVSSFHVELMNHDGQWVQNIPALADQQIAFDWPKALRVTIVQAHRERQWILPFFLAKP